MKEFVTRRLIQLLRTADLPSERRVRSADGRRFTLCPRELMHENVLYFGETERDSTSVIERLVELGDLVLDLGANFGWYTTLFSTLVGPSGLVMAFEPVPPTFERLVKNIALNGFLNVRAHNCALDRESGQKSMFVFNGLPDGHASLSNLGRSDFSFYEVETKTLDSFLDLSDQPAVVKIDVEGAEMAIIDGASKMFQRCTPRLMIEVNVETACAFGYHPRDLIRRLSQFGYSFFRVAGYRTLEELTYGSRIENGDNLICLATVQDVNLALKNGIRIKTSRAGVR